MIVKKLLKMESKLPIGHDTNKFFPDCHQHTYFEFFYIIRGKALNVVNDEIQLLEPMRMAMMRPMDAHYIKKIEDNDEEFEFYNIPVPVEYMEKQFIHCPELREIMIKPEIPPMVKLSSAEFAMVTSRAKALDELPPSPKREFIYYSLCKDLCACILSHKMIKIERTPDWFTSLVLKLEDLDPAQLDYELLVDVSDVSKKQLWKLFVKIFGVSPTKYINKRKAQAAYTQILTTDKKLTDIGLDLGYGSYTHFYREFRKYYGFSPGELRKNQR